MKAALAQVTSFMHTHNVTIPPRDLLSFHMLRGTWSHPLFGPVLLGITDGVTCYISTARGVFHTSLGQMDRITHERSPSTPRTKVSPRPTLEHKLATMI